MTGLFIAQRSFSRKWKWHLASKWRPPSPSRSLREHDSNWAIMKCFWRSVGKFRAVWGSYKSGLVLAWGRNPIINLLAADTVLLSPCPACKAHLNTINAAVPLHLTRGAAVQAQLCLQGSAARIKHTLCCMWQAPASSLCVGPTGTNLLPIELGCSFLQQEPGPNL